MVEVDDMAFVPVEPDPAPSNNRQGVRGPQRTKAWSDFGSTSNVVLSPEGNHRYLVFSSSRFHSHHSRQVDACSVDGCDWGSSKSDVGAYLWLGAVVVEESIL